MPADQNLAAGIPDVYPTYDLNIRTNGLNEADEMNLYRPNALMDSPYGPTDLEWLYRSQDVDGPSLLSRLADLAPISFTNTIDGQRRRRLFAVESWEIEQLRLDERQPRRQRVPEQQPIHADGQRRASPARRNADPASRPATLCPSSDPIAGPARQEDQPQLSAPGFQRSQRANPPEVDQRDVSASQGNSSPPGRRYSGRAGPAQPVRDQHHRFPRPGLHDDPLAEPGRPARAGTACESLAPVLIPRRPQR